MPLRGTESTFELTTLQRLDALKNQHAFGMDIERPRGGAGGALSLSKWSSRCAGGYSPFEAWSPRRGWRIFSRLY